MTYQKERHIIFYLNDVEIEYDVSCIKSNNIKVFVNDNEIKDVTNVSYEFTVDILYVEIQDKVVIKVYPHNERIVQVYIY